MRSEPERLSKNGMEIDGPVTGLNDNVEFLGRLLHVQTEMAAQPAPRIVTQVFSNGRVVFSKRLDLTQDGLPGIERIRELMRLQHSRTMREIADKQRETLAKRNETVK